MAGSRFQLIQQLEALSNFSMFHHKEVFQMKRSGSSIFAVFVSVVLVYFLSAGVAPALAQDFNWRKYEGTTIRCLMSKSAFTKDNIKHIKDFEALSGITVQHEHYPSQQLRKKVLVELGGGNKDLDMFQGLMKMAFQYEGAGWLYPLDAFLTDPAMKAPGFDYNDFFPQLKAKINGKTIGLVNSTNPQVLIYRKDLFEKYGIKVPGNWQELEAAAKKLTMDTDGDGKTDIFGWIARMDQENTAPFASFLYNNNATYLDKNRRPVFNSPQAVEALEMYGRLARDYGPPGAATIGWKEVVGALAQGKAAMTVEISIFAKMILENPKSSKVAGKLGYAPFPASHGGAYKAVLPCNMYFISSMSEKKEAAWLLLQYLGQKKVVMDSQMKGLPTPLKSVWTDPQFKAADTLPELSALQFDAIQNGIIGFEIPIAGFSEARPVIQRLIYTAYEGGNVQKAADEAVAEVQEIMKRTE
jgi:multiple sugar transport system substrate-binding protein